MTGKPTQACTLPDFVCIGTFRAGTTWLQSVLEQHAEIFVPFEKETKYFSRYYHRGGGWYADFFGPCRHGMLAGEICPTYLSDDNAPRRIFETVPGVKLIAILREPAEQILSLYKLALQRGYTGRSLEAELEAEPRYLENVRYFSHLSRYLSLFDRRALLVLFYEDLRADRNGFLRQIYDFLGVSCRFPEESHSVNRSYVPRFHMLDRLVSRGGDFMRNHNLYRIKEVVNRTGLVAVVKGWNQDEKRRIVMGADTRMRINNELVDDVGKLARLTGRNLEHWLASG